MTLPAAGTLPFFALVFPALEGFYGSSDMGIVTLQQLMGVNHWVVIVLLAVAAFGMFVGIDRWERRTRPVSRTDAGSCVREAQC